MFWLSLLGGIYFIIVGISGKGRAYRSKMGTPLSGKEAKTVKVIYLSVGIVLLIIAVFSGIELFSGV